ncbi:isoprenylcysteine carboxylmethyltransferase family protein, partial [Streptomyces albidoflavus]
PVLAHRPFLPVLGWPMQSLVLLAQALRWWCITTLGPYWNTRVIVVPGARPIGTGPYRLVRHPNYIAVVVEVAALPLVHSAWLSAAVFSTANAVLLTVRLRCENAALSRAVHA